MGAKQGAFVGRPTAFGAEGEDDGGAFEEAARAEGRGRFVVVQGDAGGDRGGGEGGDDIGKRAAVGDDREVGVEGLFGADDEMAAPFAGGPEGTAGVVGIAFFGGDEVQGGDAERGGVAENVAGGLRAREAEDKCDRRGGRRGRGVPGEGERKRGEGDGGERGLAARTVNQAAVERISDMATEHTENVQGARIGARERDGGLGGIEEDEVHAVIGPACRGGARWQRRG